MSDYAMLLQRVAELETENADLRARLDEAMKGAPAPVAPEAAPETAASVPNTAVQGA